MGGETDAHLTKMLEMEYLNKTLKPILVQALVFLDKKRPSDPISSLIQYLLEHKHMYEQDLNSLPFVPPDIDN